MKVILKLNPEDIAKAIKTYLKVTTASNHTMTHEQIDAAKIEFNVRDGYRSNDPRENSSAQLDGITVTL